MPTLHTIEEVIEQLDAIVAVTRDRGDPAGLFAALYRAVTKRVLDGVLTGAFDDGPRMVALDTTFAQRYFDAYHAWRAGATPPRCWEAALTATLDPHISPLQHLLLGINAHICLDLAIAAAAVAPGDAIESLRGDFDQINEILAAMIETVQEALNDGNPLLRAFDVLLCKADELAAYFGLLDARDNAWSAATLLARLEGPSRQQAIDTLDNQTTSTARLLTAVKPLRRWKPRIRASIQRIARVQ